MLAERPRLLVVLVPRLLADGLIDILKRTNIDDVFDLEPDSEFPAGLFDAAIVSSGVARALDNVRVVVTVPRDIDPWMGTVSVNGERPTSFAISGPADILAVLDELCPDPAGRQRRLRVVR